MDKASASSAFRVPLERILREQTALLYRQNPGLFAGGTIGSLIVAWVFWGEWPRLNIIVWLSAVFAAHLFAAASWWAYRRTGTEHRGHPRWRFLFTAVTGVAGATWGASGLLLFAPDSLPLQLFLALFLFGAGAAAMTSTAVYLPAFAICFYPMQLPFLLNLSWQATPTPLALAATGALYVALLSFFARNIHRTVHESLMLRFENEALAADLVKRTDEAEHANLAKSRFLAAASHDLRQPMHALGLLVDALATRVRELEAGAILTRVQRSVDAMEGMFNALLDVSKLDAGALQPELTGFGLNTMLDRMRADYGPQATAKNVRLRVVPTRSGVASDPVLLERLVRNLVSNAVTHTARGRVLVGCRRRGENVRIEVWDTGCGIGIDQREEIFQEFYQLGNPARDREKGLGLGLAIVRRISNLLGHPIELKSTPGRGSMFAVTVPRMSVWASTLPRSEPVVSRKADLTGRLIVVLEDDRAVMEAMRQLLIDWGCEVVAGGTIYALEAELGRSARSPDAIIADYRLPQAITGAQTAAELARRLGKAIPTILVTGDTGPDSLQEIAASGYPWLCKPVRPAKLRALLTSIIANTAFRKLPASGRIGVHPD